MYAFAVIAKMSEVSIFKNIRKINEEKFDMIYSKAKNHLILPFIFQEVLSKSKDNRQKVSRKNYS